MRRVLVLPALFASLLACKSADEHSAKTNTDAQTESTSTSPALNLPAVELPDPGTRQADAQLWVTADAIWVGGASQKPARVVELTSITNDAPDLIEPLAEALHRLAAAQPNADVMLMDPNAFGFELVLRVDADTTVGVLRRVLTTARATGHRRIRYESAKGSVELTAEVPVQDEQRFDEVLLISADPTAGTDDGLSLNGRPLARDVLLTKLQQMLEYREMRCVMLDLPPTARYAEWLAFAAELAARKVDCVTVPSLAAPADNNEPPPPPPPPAWGDDDAAPPKPEPKPGPEPEPATARVEHWWAQARASAAEQVRARCEQALTPLHEVAEADLTADQLLHLTRLEADCGESKRVEALRVLRTERFPDDWRSWYALAAFRFEPLFPDPASQLPYRPELEPAKRKAIAEQVIATLERAKALAPTERDPRIWASMAHTQLALAWEAETGEAAQRHARVERMRAWQEQQVICEASSVGGCPPAPSTDEQFTADLAALGESR